MDFHLRGYQLTWSDNGDSRFIYTNEELNL